MKKLISFVGLVILGFLTSCYDDTLIQNSLIDLTERVEKLETLCTEMNTNIASLQAIVNASETGDAITEVVPIIENGVEVGYSITFAQSGTFIIYHGKDGQDGTDGAPGQDGQDGKDGMTPVIGLRQDTDGIWYWTLNGEWLHDEDGNKVKAVGTDGKDGQNGAPGNDGKNGQDGADGKDGVDGKDGITPLLKIENDFWHISYDNGLTWTELGKAKGEDGKDGADGKDGTNGTIGGDLSSITSIFKSVYWDDSYVYFILIDGTRLVIPLASEEVLAIEFIGAESLDFNIGKPVSVDFEVTGASGLVTVETICENGWCAEVEMTSALDGTLTLTPPIPLRNGKVIVFATDTAGKVAMKSLIIDPDFITLVSDVLSVSQKGGIVAVTLTTNLDYIVNIPEMAKNWISHVATKAVRTDTLEFSVIENPADTARTADITLYSEEAGFSKTFTVLQYGKLTLPDDEETPADTNMIITFIDKNVKSVLVSNFDTNSDGEISVGEAQAVTSLGTIFRNNDKILTFEELEHFTSLKTISEDAFYDCGALMKIRLPKNITEIEDRAFKSCSSLVSVEVPASVKEIGEYAFYYCSSLNKVILNEGLTIIGNYAFASTSILNEIIIPDTVYNLGDDAFYSSGIQKAVIPASVIELNSATFYACKSLKEVILEEGLLRLEDAVFYGCSVLSSISLPSTLVSIGSSCFYDCEQLSCITVPETVTKISDYCFYGCSALSEIQLSKNLTSIGYGAFYDCSSLKGITLPKSLISLGREVFSGCKSLTSIEIPSSVTSLPQNAFSGCTSLTSVSLPSNMTSIGSHAFSGCTSLTSLVFPTSLNSLGGYCLAGTGVKEFTLPEHLWLSDGMFRDCKSLEKVTLHSDLKLIRDYCFAGCTNLKSIKIPTSVTELGTHAFSASGLTEIVVPETVTTMSSSVFSECKDLLKAEINANISKLPDYTFEYCNSLSQFGLGNYITTIGREAFKGCNAFTEVVIPEQIKHIDMLAFSECMSLNCFTYPSKVTEVSDYMFYLCPNLKTVIFNENMTEVGTFAFSKSGIETISLPEGITTIGSYCFEGCDIMTDLTLPSTLKFLGAYWIDDCPALNNIVCKSDLPPTIDAEYYFNLSASFTKIYVPASSLDAYKSARGWSKYASQIEAIGE